VSQPFVFRGAMPGFLGEIRIEEEGKETHQILIKTVKST
jgi:hypothetical protein